MAGSLDSMAEEEVAEEAVVAVICIAGSSAAGASYVDMALQTAVLGEVGRACVEDTTVRRETRQEYDGKENTRSPPLSAVHPEAPPHFLSSEVACEDAVAGVGQTGRGLPYAEAGVVAQVAEGAGYNDHWK
uniref:Uncharacterized protein n=1 Tax=Micrurus corallinus TaxID=54390 RepID=A0A2D4GHA8_MICCO